MLQDPISKPPDVQMDQVSRAATDHRRSKPSTANSEQLVVKCPRCDSLNTKFCYYNNYSLTQPRHFCKNCRRYWTQGGSLRNVPIGGGCRKNKRVKQRAVDPHLFGGLVDQVDHMHHGGPGSFLQQYAASGAAGSNYFMAATGTSVPGFDDLVNPSTNDSHLLSMAFSRLQESLRVSGEQSGARPLSLMHSTSLYDSEALDLSNSFVKPEQHHLVFNGSELGSSSSLFEHHVSSSSAPPPTGLASLEDQLPNYHSFGGTELVDSSQLKHELEQQGQQALALHLGGGGGGGGGGGSGAADQHQHRHVMANPASCSSTGGSNAGAVNAISTSCGTGTGTRSHPAERYMINFHHHRHAGLSLPDFEDHDSPESMSSIMNMRRSGLHADKYVNMQQVDDHRSIEMIDHHQSWQHVSSTGGGAPASQYVEQQQQLQSAHREAATRYIHPVTTGSSSHAAAGEQISNFWSPSPWSSTSCNQDAHTTGALL